MADAKKTFSFDLAQVALVLSPYQVVINKGSADGVRPGQAFLFFVLGPVIKDPATGLDLGKIEILRGKGEVIHLQERIATVKSTERTLARSSSSMFGALAPITREYEDRPFDDITIGDFARPV